VQLVSKIATYVLLIHERYRWTDRWTDGRTDGWHAIALPRFSASCGKNQFSAGAQPRTPSGELTTLPQTGRHPSRLGRGTPGPAHTFPAPTPSASRYPHCLRRLGSYVPPIQSSGYAYVVRGEGAQMIFLQGGPKFEVTPLAHANIIRI